MTCDTCGRTLGKDRFNPDCQTPLTCFGCRVRTVNIGFGGHREFFHNDTIKSFQERQVAEAKSNGLNPIPAWHNTNTGTTSGGMKKLQQAHKELADSKGSRPAL